MYDCKNKIECKLNQLTYGNSLVIILGANINEDHIRNFFFNQKENISILCMSNEFYENDYLYVNGTKELVQFHVDFNILGVWMVINDYLIKKKLTPEKIIVDWSTAKFISGSFAINNKNGKIMQIILKWISIFGCEFYSPCSYESSYPINCNFKEPQFYNFFLFTTYVPLKINADAVDFIWIENFNRYLQMNYEDLQLMYFQKSNNYSLFRDVTPVTKFFKLVRK